jgi:hypothetical protein
MFKYKISVECVLCGKTEVVTEIKINYGDMPPKIKTLPLGWNIVNEEIFCDEHSVEVKSYGEIVRDL